MTSSDGLWFPPAIQNSTQSPSITALEHCSSPRLQPVPVANCHISGQYQQWLSKLFSLWRHSRLRPGCGQRPCPALHRHMDALPRFNM